MSDSMFNELVDDIFVKGNKSMDERDIVSFESKYDVNNADDKELINNRVIELTKLYIDSNASKENKLSFLKFKNQYLIIKNIKDYENIEKTLYAGKTRNQLIKFEISRILKNIDGNVKVSDQIANIEKLLKLSDGNLSDELYFKIIKLIIKIELFLGMKIGLFSELCFLFEAEMEEIERSCSKKR